MTPTELRRYLRELAGQTLAALLDTRTLAALPDLFRRAAIEVEDTLAKWVREGRA